MFSVEFSVSVKFCLTKAKTFRIIKSEFHIHSNASKLHMQESPSGMASASQADPGGFDSRFLLHNKKSSTFEVLLFCYNQSLRKFYKVLR